MTRHHMIDGIKVDFTPEEETTRDAEELEWVSAKPMEDWKESMQGTDAGMPRFLEDVLDMTGTNGLAQATLDKYTAKKTLRLTKPE